MTPPSTMALHLLAFLFLSPAAGTTVAAFVTPLPKNAPPQRIVPASTAAATTAPFWSALEVGRDVRIPRRHVHSRQSPLSTTSALPAVAPAAGAAAAALSVSLAPPLLPPLAAACILPSLLGFYRSEYGVSYGYGTAIAASAFLVLRSLAPVDLLSQTVTIAANASALWNFLSSNLAATHAAALFFYGARLDLFLLYREVCLPRFREMRERIEDRAAKRGGRLSRAPFLLSCATLYLCMACPTLVTSGSARAMAASPCFTAGGTALTQALRAAIFATWGGFLLGALGDLTKSVQKARRGTDALIAGGIFRFLRHPNYTGEAVGWTASCTAAFLAAAIEAGSVASGTSRLGVLKAASPLLAASAFGAMGILFVLGTATAGLEDRQKEKYGDTEEYKEWVKTSWGGFRMGSRKGSKGKGDDDGGAPGDVDETGENKGTREKQ